MSRTGEVALGIIGTILNVIFLIIVTLGVVGSSAMNTEEFQQMFEENMMSDPAMTQEDMMYVNEFLDVGVGLIGVIGWIFVGALVISVILSIIAVVKVSKNKSPKTAGVLFIFAGLLSGILLLAPILFYIAAIMCFVRKSTVEHVDDPYYHSDTQPPHHPL